MEGERGDKVVKLGKASEATCITCLTCINNGGMDRHSCWISGTAMMSMGEAEVLRSSRDREKAGRGKDMATLRHAQA